MIKQQIIRGGRIIDPSLNLDEVKDLYIDNGKISSQDSFHPDNPVEIDATGMIICPGFIDIHVHFREPGNENAETVASGSLAAAHGGFTSVVTMPNTSPATDSPEMITKIIQLGQSAGLVNVMPSGCISSGRKGSALADIPSMRTAGAVAFTDDGNTVRNTDLMRKAMLTAAKLNVPIMDHALDPDLAGNGVIRTGHAQSTLNLPGIPAEAETEIVQRDINLAEETNCAIHIQHISTAGAVDLIRNARKRGVRVTCEATPHHITFTDSDIPGDDTDFKMNPPLGNAKDRRALIEGIADGTITALATDHAPHTTASKLKGMATAPFGVVGLETAVGATYSALVLPGHLSLLQWIRLWTTGPATVIGIKGPSITENEPADLVVLDLTNPWIVNPDNFKSKSQNTPFKNMKLTGRAAYTFHSDRITFPCL